MRRKKNLHLLSLRREEEICHWLEHYGIPRKVKNNFGGNTYLHNIIIGYILVELLRLEEEITTRASQFGSKEEKGI